MRDLLDTDGGFLWIKPAQIYLRVTFTEFFDIFFCLLQRLQERELHGLFGRLELRLAHAQIIENGAVVTTDNDGAVVLDVVDDDADADEA